LFKKVLYLCFVIHELEGKEPTVCDSCVRATAGWNSLQATVKFEKKDLKKLKRQRKYRSKIINFGLQKI